MEKERKVELILRMLGIRHKLKVHESMKSPESHEDLSVSLLAKWELEDELRAIEEIIATERTHNVGGKRQLIEEGILGGKKLQKRPNAASAKKSSPANGR